MNSLRTFFRKLFEPTVTIRTTTRSSRPMTAEESAQFDKVFEEMDRFFRMMRP